MIVQIGNIPIDTNANKLPNINAKSATASKYAPKVVEAFKVLAR